MILCFPNEHLSLNAAYHTLSIFKSIAIIAPPDTLSGGEPPVIQSHKPSIICSVKFSAERARTNGEGCLNTRSRDYS